MGNRPIPGGGPTGKKNSGEKTYSLEWQTPEKVEREAEQRLRDACQAYVGEKYAESLSSSVGQVPFDGGHTLWTTDTAKKPPFPGGVNPKNPFYYDDMVIQPSEYIMANQIPWCEANAIKYISRWRNKGGVDDLKKAVRYLEMLIEQETK